MARRKTKTIYIWGYTVMLSPLKRKSIYGERKIVAKNADNSECVKAYLSENGTELYPKGATSLCKTDKDGNAYISGKTAQDNVEEITDYFASPKELQNELYRYSPKGREFTASMLSSFCGDVTGTYTLEDFDQAMVAEVIGNEIYQYDLATGKNTYKKSLVFQRNGTVFLLTYEDGSVRAAKRNSPPELDDSPVYSDLDQIDFEMF